MKHSEFRTIDEGDLQALRESDELVFRHEDGTFELVARKQLAASDSPWDANDTTFAERKMVVGCVDDGDIRPQGMDDFRLCLLPRVWGPAKTLTRHAKKGCGIRMVLNRTTVADLLLVQMRRGEGNRARIDTYLLTAAPLGTFGDVD